jgi:hypothetical protein
MGVVLGEGKGRSRSKAQDVGQEDPVHGLMGHKKGGPQGPDLPPEGGEGGERAPGKVDKGLAAGRGLGRVFAPGFPDMRTQGARLL